MAFCCCGTGGTASVTAKNTNQLRHLEMIGISRGPSPRLRRTEVQIPVTLNVYSLLESNKKLSKMGMGVFHTGVVVYGIEWGYGEVVENPNASGLFCVHPGQAAGTLHRTLRIGYTTRSPMQVDTILHRLENEWRSCEYHILHHNCNHFAQAFCDLLSTTEKLRVPSWCNRAARVGDRVIPRKLATKVQHMMDDEPPKAVAPTPFCNINEVPLSVVPREWYLHPSVFQPMRYTGSSRADSLQSRDNVAAAAAAASAGNGDAATAPAAATSYNGGGGSHYTVEYDILPPPGYEVADVSSPYPPLMHREVYLATDENGSISRMTAIEEQPSVTRSTRVDSTRKSTRSHRAAKLTPGHSPAPPPLGSTGASVGNDRITVLPRVRASASHAQSVAPTGSPQASMVDTETESVLHSESSDDFPVDTTRRAATITAEAARLLSASLDGSQHGKQRRITPREEEGFSEKPLYTMRETSLHSTSLSASQRSFTGAGHMEVERPPLVLHRQAQPVGCITALPAATPSAPVVEKDEKSGKGRRESATHDRRHSSQRASTVATSVTHASVSDSDSEASLHAGAAAAAAAATDTSKLKRGKDGAARRHSETKRLADFTEIVAVPHDNPTDVSVNTSPTAPDGKKKSTAWVKLFKGRSSTTSSEVAKKGKKYLSTPPRSDVGSHTDGDNIPDTVSETSSFPASLGTSAVQPRRQQPAAAAAVPTTPPPQRAPAIVATGAEAVTSAASGDHTPTAMEVESVSDTGLDMHGMKDTTTVFVPPSPTLPALPRPPSVLQRRSENAPALFSGPATPTASVESRRSPRLGAPTSPQMCQVSNPSSASELHLQPLPRRLSESAVALPVVGGAADVPQSPGAASLPECAALVDDSPAQRSSTHAATPERVLLPTTDGAATTSASPATARRRTHRAGSSSLRDSLTPPPSLQHVQPPERSRTPIPSSRKRLARHSQHASSSLLLDFGGDVIESPAPRMSSLSSTSQVYASAPPHRSSSRAGGEVGTPLSPDRIAHTPMAPFPRRPSLLSRERASVSSVKSIPLTPEHSRSALAAQRSLTLEVKETPPKSPSPADSRTTFDEV